jgi:hypothetical protein
MFHVKHLDERQGLSLARCHLSGAGATNLEDQIL